MQMKKSLVFVVEPGESYNQNKCRRESLMLTTPAVPYGCFSVTKIPFSEYWEEAELSAEQCWE